MGSLKCYAILIDDSCFCGGRRPRPWHLCMLYNAARLSSNGTHQWPLHCNRHEDVLECVHVGGNVLTVERVSSTCGVSSVSCRL